MRTIVDTGIYGEYMHYGMPLTLVTVADGNGRVNVSTNTSITPLPGDPLRLVLGVFRDNYTNDLLSESGEFVVNLVTKDMRAVAKQCGEISGKNVDKLELCGLHTLPATYVSAPLIEECPLNLECKVDSVHHLEDMDLWVAKVLAMQVAPGWANGRGGVDLGRFDPLFYAFGHTLSRGPLVGVGGL